MPELLGLLRRPLRLEFGHPGFESIDDMLAAPSKAPRMSRTLGDDRGDVDREIAADNASLVANNLQPSAVA